MASNQGGAMRPNGPHAQWFKLVLLGEMAVGKSSLAIRLVSGVFHKSQDSTIGAARLSHTVCLGDAAVRLEIWDTAGQERFHSLANLFYRGAQAAVVVYDITSEPSFVRAKSWVEELRTKASPDMVIALAGNKADLADRRAVDARDARSYADDNGLLFMETSAKTSANVDEIFAAVAERLLPPEGSEEPPQAAGSGQSRGVDLEATPPAKVKAPCCSWKVHSAKDGQTPAERFSETDGDNFGTEVLTQPNDQAMGRGASEEWNEKHADTIQSQPQHMEHKAQPTAVAKEDDGDSQNGCMKCCMQTKNCLMSGECGRCLQIASVVSFCGMCIRMWV